MSFKSEMYLLELDKFMLSHKRFQTREEWEIELKCRKQRTFSYLASFATFVVARGAFMSTEALLARVDPYVISEPFAHRGCWWRAGWFSKVDRFYMTPQGPVARYYQFLRGMKRLPVRHGMLQLGLAGVPAYMTYVCLNHWAQNQRLNSYLRQPTVFGALARELVKSNELDKTQNAFILKSADEFLAA
eukprot:NODE_2040_length_664_cov_152.261789_g1596_i0.p2 GENE.NODE_2040_length_664_cov_152.261789_g1596_i0~~NODE_2040_length_664_cov_152.261789_g1596_i0.p2  ORF type:complete len:204 (+),score=32.00 NODE_2040_length_664_cov_152.261789_g1596_i0:49-612(+)